MVHLKNLDNNLLDNIHYEQILKLDFNELGNYDR